MRVTTDAATTVFSDAHYARYWDHVAVVVHDRPDVINPKAELGRFVDRCDAARPVVNLGDSIDYHYCGYHPGTIAA